MATSVRAVSSLGWLSTDCRQPRTRRRSSAERLTGYGSRMVSASQGFRLAHTLTALLKIFDCHFDQFREQCLLERHEGEGRPLPAPPMNSVRGDDNRLALYLLVFSVVPGHQRSTRPRIAHQSGEQVDIFPAAASADCKTAAERSLRQGELVALHPPRRPVSGAQRVPCAVDTRRWLRER